MNGHKNPNDSRHYRGEIVITTNVSGVVVTMHSYTCERYIVPILPPALWPKTPPEAIWIR